MDRWQKFLDSLATRGGAVFVLAAFALMGIVLVFVVIGFRLMSDEKVWAFATGYVMGWANALTLALKAGDDNKGGEKAQ